MTTADHGFTPVASGVSPLSGSAETRRGFDRSRIRRPSTASRRRPTARFVRKNRRGNFPSCFYGRRNAGFPACGFAPRLELGLVLPTGRGARGRTDAMSLKAPRYFHGGLGHDFFLIKVTHGIGDPPRHHGTGRVSSGPESRIQAPKSSDRSVAIGGTGHRDPGTGHVVSPRKAWRNWTIASARRAFGLGPIRNGREERRMGRESFSEKKSPRSKVQGPRSVIRRRERRLTLDFGPRDLGPPPPGRDTLFRREKSRTLECQPATVCPMRGILDPGGRQTQWARRLGGPQTCRNRDDSTHQPSICSRPTTLRRVPIRPGR